MMLAVESLHSGLIRLSIISDEQTLSIELTQKDCARTVAKILETAEDSFVESGQPPEDYTRQSIEWASLQPATLGLAPSQLPNHESLLVQFGNAVLAIPIERSQLRTLGEAMVALSADSDRGH
jgi:hypothetical protein